MPREVAATRARQLTHVLLLAALRRYHAGPRVTGALASVRQTRLVKWAWRIAGRSARLRRLVERLRGVPPAPEQIDFATFMHRADRLRRKAWPELLRHVAVMPFKPIFSIVIEGDDAAGIERTRASLRQQLWLDWRELAVPVAWPLPPEALRDADFLVVLPAGDRLAPDALYAFAAALNAEPDLDLIYVDEDRLDDAGRHDQPFFKPGWSPDYLEAFNYIGHAAGYRIAAARPAAAASLYDFVLQLTQTTQRIRHLPQVLYHLAATARQVTASQDISALHRRLISTGRIGDVTPGRIMPGYYDITLRPDFSKLVSIVMPTAGQRVVIEGRELDLVRHCVDSILARSTYTNFEIILVDSGDIDDARKTALEADGCRFITYPHSNVNVAAKINLGASIARGDILIILNDDMEIIAPDWIERMLDHLAKPHVGVVGARLLYPDRTFQHVGMIHNFGDPEHVRRFYPSDDPGYFYSSCATRNFSAVTGACMMSRRDVFLGVGGYSEEFGICYNDVDYCFKLRQSGLFVVHAPRAELFHFESQSRDPMIDPEELRAFQLKWAEFLTSDPFYNERQLSVTPPTFEPHCNPRVL